MKTIVILVLIAIAGYLWYHKIHDVSGPVVIKDPVYAEMRATNVIAGREIEMAVFVRAGSDAECRVGAREGIAAALQNCPTCALEPPKCHEQLPPRYARLFDDVPIPSTYLSLTSGNALERDARIVVYGLTDAEGPQVCEALRSQLAERYHGEIHCVKASGG